MAGKYCIHCGSSDIILTNQDEWQDPNCPVFECRRCHAVFGKPELCVEAADTPMRSQRRSPANSQPSPLTVFLITFTGLLAIGIFCYFSFTDSSFVRFMWELNLDKWIKILGGFLENIYILLFICFIIFPAIMVVSRLFRKFV